MTGSRTIVFLLIISLLISLLTACNEPQKTVEVIEVIDGDTIVVEGGYHVRYIGIDAPEKGEPYYREATEINRELVGNKRVRLETDITERDRYGRLLRYVYVDNAFVNAEIVRCGYAYSKAYPPDIKYQIYLEAVEKEARMASRGVWEQ